MIKKKLDLGICNVCIVSTDWLLKDINYLILTTGSDRFSFSHDIPLILGFHVKI